MSPVRVTWRRTLGALFGSFLSGASIAAFLAVSSILFVFNLDAAEGGDLLPASLWSLSVSQVLPVLAAFLAMDVWCAERASGRLDVLLSTAVRERDLVFGKFLGVLTVLILSLLASWVLLLAVWMFFAKVSVLSGDLRGFLLGFSILTLQGLLWCAVSVMMSAAFRHGAMVVLASVFLTAGLPRGVWLGLMAFSPLGRSAFGEMPLDAQAIDFAAGELTTGAIVSYLVLSAMALLVATKAVASGRLVGSGARILRCSTRVTVFIAFVFSACAVVTASRFSKSFDLSGVGSSEVLSGRTRTILAECGGEMTLTCFLPRSDARFRSTAHLLRIVQHASDSVGGARMNLRFVDPRWDVGDAQRLISRGIAENAVVFEKGHRLAVVPIDEGFGERMCASTIQRVAMPPPRRNVYWTKGHGETAFDSYGSFGMSDIARDLVTEGYLNRHLDLAKTEAVPADCALVVIAGARDDFSRIEQGRLDAYLKGGGRLLVLVSSPAQGGLTSVLSRWGVRAENLSLEGKRTLSGSDVIVSDFSDHVISAPIRGMRIVLDRPLRFSPSAAVTGAGADRIEFSSVASVGADAVVAAVERGAGAGEDLAIRPTRIVTVGDAGFALNGSLSARASSNRDFFLNCIAYLAGTDVAGVNGLDADGFNSGLDRRERLRFAIASALVLPLAVFCLLAAVILWRRRED